MALLPSYIESSKHNILYFRIRIPQGLPSVFARSYVRRSLQTKCEHEAIIRCAMLLEKSSASFRWPIPAIALTSRH